jgi:large subunit ribosomal protein L22
MSKATLKHIRLSPNKARLIAREVQGMNAEIALASLEFMPNKAAGIIAKVIASAVANGDYEPEEATILSARVDKASVLKRFKPRARGSASGIRKPTCHIMIEVGTVIEKVDAPKKAEKKEAPKKEAKKAPAKKETKKAEKKETSKNKEEES